MTLPVPWIVGLMVALEPSAPWRPTYEKSAEAIARVADAEPAVDGDSAKTEALLVAMEWHESRLKPSAVSRNGKWVCLFQVAKGHLDDPKKALDDPETCTRAAMKILKQSLKACASLPSDERLAFFMSGACDKGRAQSRYRMFMAKKLLKEHPLPAAQPNAVDRDVADKNARVDAGVKTASAK